MLWKSARLSVPIMTIISIYTRTRSFRRLITSMRRPFSKTMRNRYLLNPLRTKMDSLADSYLSSIHLATTSFSSFTIMDHKIASFKNHPFAERTTYIGCRPSRSTRNRLSILTINRKLEAFPKLRLSKSWNNSSSKSCKTSLEVSSTNKRRSFHRLL